MYRRHLLALIAAAFACSPALAAAQSAGPRPSVAVLNFSTQGLTSDWYGSFQPGVALSDLLTDRMVNDGRFNVLDRTHLSSTLGEHQLAASGEVDPQTAVTAGRMIGARYLVTGNILQLDQTGASGANVGSYLPGPFGAAAGGVSTHRVTIKVAVRVIDAKTGQIVQSFSDEATRSGTSWSAGGFSGYAAGSYSNSTFVNSDMGHLIDDEANKIASTLDPSRFNSGPVAPQLTGHIAAIDGSHVIIDIGANVGVQAGQTFDIVKQKSLVDPTTHQVLHVNENIGRLQIDSVSSNASVGHVVSGKAAVRVMVTSQPNP
ncbi:MAG TPA: CsgG/HfaB family protein [Candidatus Dormibacteraeota bacterium]|nr:CsgG/HfaB family protein [Candidatus Dormibacteraeota bacterium]